MGYFRFGTAHSAFLSTPDQHAMTKLISACRQGAARSKYYFIAQLFPNLVVGHFRSDAQFWHILIQQYVPVSHDRSILRAWLYPAPFAANHAWHVRWTRRFVDPWRTLAIRYYVDRIRKEDHAVCEGLQSIAHQIESPPFLGRLEERIAWFEEAYKSALAEGSGESG
jgi:hypothetical protein